MTTMEDPANIELLKNVLSKAMDMDIYVQAVLTSAAKSNTPPSEVDKRRDGSLSFADLGGEIVDIQ